MLKYMLHYNFSSRMKILNTFMMITKYNILYCIVFRYKMFVILTFITLYPDELRTVTSTVIA